FGLCFCWFWVFLCVVVGWGVFGCCCGVVGCCWWFWGCWGVVCVVCWGWGCVFLVLRVLFV
ncbi:hypothetical protein RA276_28710, partial [Pseudomonas syringae pv. tagetis]|uniref:hypothetical protein n=1 Tax=Pseudomonas syringae group genomosp. 7 TaxID=251699 RepID=UPI00376F856E